MALSEPRKLGLNPQPRGRRAGNPHLGAVRHEDFALRGARAAAEWARGFSRIGRPHGMCLRAVGAQQLTGGGPWSRSCAGRRREAGMDRVGVGAAGVAQAGAAEASYQTRKWF